MPNHVHGVILLVGAQFIAPEPRPDLQRRRSLGEVIRTFKAASTRLIRENTPPRRIRLDISSNPPKVSIADPGFGWQRGYYEHVVRNEDPENPAVESNAVRD